MNISNVKEFIAALRSDPYTSIDCYPIFFITADNGILSYKAAKENALLIGRAIQSKANKQWEVVAIEINWEDPELYCDDSGERIESVYAEPKVK